MLRMNFLYEKKEILTMLGAAYIGVANLPGNSTSVRVLLRNSGKYYNAGKIKSREMATVWSLFG